MKIKTWMQKYPLVSYFVLAFVISWVGSFAVVSGKFLRGETMVLEDGLRMAVLVLAGPSIAGLLMSYLVNGKHGVRELISRMTKWQVNLRWYAAALIVFPVLILAILLALSNFVSPDYTPGFVTFGITAGLLAGFVEEIGWMGFAYPRMRSRHGVMRATLLLALLPGVWHFLPNYLGDSQHYGPYLLPRFIAMWIVAMTAMRILLVWIYTNTGSLLLAQLTHASSTGFLFILGPTTVSPYGETFWWSIYAVVLWVAAGIVLLRYGPSLEARPDARVHRIPDARQA